MKKFFVVTVLFALPIVAYLFFASGKNNFARLPVLKEDVKDISHLEGMDGDSVSFHDKISVVAFFGDDLQAIKGNTFNLDQKILEKYYQFDDFQFVIVLPERAKAEAKEFAEEFKGIAGTEHWKFAFGEEPEIRQIFESLGTDYQLNDHVYSPYVFIVDKDASLRGRDDDEDVGRLYGYDSRSVGELHNKMNDDVRVILAEYRLALKKYNSEAENKEE